MAHDRAGPRVEPEGHEDADEDLGVDVLEHGVRGDEVGRLVQVEVAGVADAQLDAEPFHRRPVAELHHLAPGRLELPDALVAHHRQGRGELAGACQVEHGIERLGGELRAPELVDVTQRDAGRAVQVEAERDDREPPGAELDGVVPLRATAVAAQRVEVDPRPLQPLAGELRGEPGPAGDVLLEEVVHPLRLRKVRDGLLHDRLGDPLPGDHGSGSAVVARAAA